MNAEIMQQLYGGEISDYSAPKLEQRKYESPEASSSNIGDIYETQIKGKQSIDTERIYNTSLTLPKFIKDERSKALDQMLSDTLSLINQQINITDVSTSTVNTRATLQMKDQTKDDIQTANNNVLNALKELADLKAI